MVNEGVFSKCKSLPQICIITILIDVVELEPSYESKLVWETLQQSHVVRSAFLTYEQEGPALHVMCREFFATSSHQTLLFWKEAIGWGSMHTTSYSLKDSNMDLTVYIDEFSTFYLKRASEKTDHLSQIFQLARLYPNVSYYQPS